MPYTNQHYVTITTPFELDDAPDGEMAETFMGMVSYSIEDVDVVAYVEQNSTNVRVWCRTLSTGTFVWFRPFTIDFGEDPIRCEHEADTKGFRLISCIKYNETHNRLIIFFPTDIEFYQNSIVTLDAGTGAVVGWSSLSLPTRVGFLDSLGENADIMVKAWRINSVDDQIKAWRWDPLDGSITDLWEIDPTSLFPDGYTICETSGMFWQSVPNEEEEPEEPDPENPYEEFIFESDTQQWPCLPGYILDEHKAVFLLSGFSEDQKTAQGKIIWVNIEDGSISKTHEIEFTGKTHLKVSHSQDSAISDAQDALIEEMNGSQQFPWTATFPSLNGPALSQVAGWACFLPADTIKVSLLEASNTDYRDETLDEGGIGSGLGLIDYYASQDRGYEATGWSTLQIPNAAENVNAGIDDILYSQSAVQEDIENIYDPIIDDPRVNWQNSSSQVFPFNTQMFIAENLLSTGNPWHGHIIACCDDGGIIVAYTHEERHRVWNNTFFRAVQIAGSSSQSIGADDIRYQSGASAIYAGVPSGYTRLSKYADVDSLPDPYSFGSVNPDTGSYTGADLPVHAILDHPTWNGTPVPDGVGYTGRFDLWTCGVILDPEVEEDPPYIIAWTRSDGGGMTKLLYADHPNWGTGTEYTGTSGNLAFGALYGWDPKGGTFGEYVQIGTVTENEVSGSFLYEVIGGSGIWQLSTGGSVSGPFDHGDPVIGNKYIAPGATCPDLTFHLVPGYADSAYYRCKIMKFDNEGAIVWEQDVSREDLNEETQLVEPSTNGIVAIRPTKTGGFFMVISKPNNAGQSFGAGTPYMQYRNEEDGELEWEEQIALEDFTWYISSETPVTAQPWILFGGSDDSESSNEHRTESFDYMGNKTAFDNFRKPLGWAGQASILTGDNFIYLHNSLFGRSLRKVSLE